MGAKSSKTGWFVAGVLALAWAGSSDDEQSSSNSAAPTRDAPRPAVVSRPAPTPPINAQPETASLPASPESRPEIIETVALYATTAVRLRSQPSTNGEILATLQPGEAVSAFGANGAWWQVLYGRRAGWVHGDYLTRDRPPPRPPAAVPPIARSVAPVRGASGQPVRPAVRGSCQCPYDRKRNGDMCGRSSAYSRPGGDSPDCYF